MKWIKKEDPTICCLQDTHLTDRNKHRLRMKGWKKIYQANGSQKEAGVAILLCDKVDFTPTLSNQIKKDIPCKYNGKYQKEIIIINLYAPNVNTSNFIKHTLKDLKAYINSNTVVVGNFNTPLS
jgi:exonuclease III